METLTMREFTREFNRHRRQSSVVTKRGKVIGRWIPAKEDEPFAEDMAERLASNYPEPARISCAQILKETRR
jgi:hypothetical protein